MLLVTDDAEVRKLIRSANWVLDRLSVLTAVKTIKHLVQTFKVSSTFYVKIFLFIRIILVNF